MNKTITPSIETIERNWFLVDAKDKTLGRLSTEIAAVLRGKNKPTFTPHLDTGDFVIVVNAEKVEVKNSWHACYSSVYRHYRYVINNSKIPNLFLNKWSWHRYQKYLDVFSMSNALDGMTGEHDFLLFKKVEVIDQLL